MKKIFKISVLLAVMTMLFGFTACSSPSAPATIVIDNSQDNGGYILTQYFQYKEDQAVAGGIINTGVSIVYTDTGRCSEELSLTNELSKGTYTISTGNYDDICKEDFTGTVTFTITQVNPSSYEQIQSGFTVGTHTVQINNGEFTLNGFTYKHKYKR